LGIRIDDGLENPERLLADLEAGRPLELAPQLGAVAEIAHRLDVPAPFVRAILGLTRLISA